MALYTLTVDLLAETGSFERDLGKSARVSDRAAKAMRQMQREMSDSFATAARDAKVSVTSIEVSLGTLAKGFGAIGGTALLGRFITETVNAQNEIAQLNAVLKSTGQAAGYNSKQLVSMADAMSKATIQSSGDIVNAQTRLLSYTSIVGENFPRALQLAIDQSVRLGEDLSQSAERVGKALEYPTKGVASLTDQGFQFTEQQKVLLKSLEDTGRLAEAQAIVMGVMEETYDAAGKAARDTLGGSLIGLKNAFDDLLGSQADSGGIKAATSALNYLASNLGTIATVVVPLSTGLAALYAGGKLATGLSALNGLWAANSVVANKAAVGMMGMVAPTVRLTAAQTAARVAAQGLNAAYAALGGPLGIAIALASVAATWWAIRDNTNDAHGALIDLNGTLDASIEKFRELNRQEQAGEMLRLQKEMKKGYDDLADSIDRMVGTASSEVGGIGFRVYAGEVRALREQFQSGQIDADTFSEAVAASNSKLLEGAPAAKRIGDRFVENTAAAARLAREYERQNGLLGALTNASGQARTATESLSGSFDVLGESAGAAGKKLAAAMQSLPGQLARVGKSAAQVAQLDVADWFKEAQASGVDFTKRDDPKVQHYLQQGEQYIRLQTQLAAAQTSFADSRKAASAADRAGAKDQKAAAESLKRYAEQAMLAAGAISGPLAEAQARHKATEKELNTALAEGKVARADANVLIAQSAKEYAKLTAEINKAMGSPEAMLATMSGELAMLGKIGPARELYRRQLMNERDMRQELAKAVEAAGSKEALAAAKGAASYEAYERSMLAAADANAVLSLQMEQAAANMEAVVNVVVYGLSDAADAFAEFAADGLRNFDNLWDDLKDVAKRGLRDMIAEITKQKLIIPIQAQLMNSISGQSGGLSLQSIMGVFGGNGSAAGGQSASTVASLLSKGQGLFGAGASTGANTLAGFGNNMAAFTGGGSAAVGGAAAASGAAGGATAALGAVAAFMPYAALIAMGMQMAGNAYGEGFGLEHQKMGDLLLRGNLMSGGLATPMMVDSMLTDKTLRALGVSGKTAAIISGSSLLGKAFGRSAPKITGQGLTGSYGFDGLAGQSYADVKQKGGWFRSDKKWTQYGALDAGIDRTFDMAARQIRGATVGLADQLGVDLSQQLASVKVSLGKLQLSADSAEAQQQLESYLADMQDRLYTEAVKAAGFGGQLDGYFESADVFSALGASIELAVGNADQLGRALNSLELEKVNKAVDYFQDLAGVAGTDLATQIEKVTGLLANYSTLMADVSTQLLTGDLSSYQQQALNTERTYRQQIKAANDYAKALGLSGARSEDLAKIEALRAMNMGKLQAQIEADKKAMQYGLSISDLSPLTDQEKLREAMGQLERSVASGDSSAAQAAAQAALGFGKNLYASGRDYNSLYSQVGGLIDSMQVGNLDLEDGTSMGELADAIEALPDNFSRAVFDLVVNDKSQAETTAAVQQSNALLEQVVARLDRIEAASTKTATVTSSSALRNSLNATYAR